MSKAMSITEYRAAVSEPRPSKYRAKRAYRCAGCGAAAEKHKCSACGGRDTLSFDSKGEAKRWDELRRLEAHGLITDLRRQYALPLIVQGKEIGKYVADFRYAGGGGWLHYEDFKGVDTPLSAWKRKHAEAQYGIKIEVVR